MFTRASNRAYVCLRCQHRLATCQPSKPQIRNPTKSIRRRWQSTGAVATAEQRDDDEGDHDSARRDTSPSTYTERGFSAKVYRRWRPTPTAELGIERLGQPAEIVVLPQNGRRKRRDAEDSPREEVVDEEAGSAAHEPESQMTVQQVLAEESRPSPPSQVIANIDRLREEIGQTDGFLDEATWDKHVKALKAGFSTRQLQRYISEKAPRRENMKHHGTTKQGLVVTIMTRIWQFSSDTPIESLYNMQRSKFELMRAIGAFEQIFSSFPEVEYSFQDHGQRPGITMYGRLEAIKLLKSLLGAPLASKSIRVRQNGQAAGTADERHSPDEPDMGDLSSTNAFPLTQVALTDLMYKHHVYAEESHLSEQSSPTFHALSDVDLFSFERDLILQQARFVKGYEHASSRLLELVDGCFTVPFYKRFMGSRSKKWHRYCQAEGAHSSEEHATEQIDQILNTMQMTKHESHSSSGDEQLLSQDIHSPSPRLQDISVQLGQAIFQETTLSTADAGAHASRIEFSSTIPFLAQFLAQQKAIVPAADSPMSVAASRTAQLLRVRFQPAEPNIHPTLEIFASMNASSKLNILEVALDFGDVHRHPASQHLLLPSLSSDLRFSFGDRLLLAQPGVPVEVNNAPLLASLAEQLRPSNPEPSLMVNQLLDLDLASLHEQKHEKPVHDQSVTQGQIGKYSEGSELTERHGVRSEVMAERPSPIKYALQTIEKVDAQWYQTPVPEAAQAADVETPYLLEYLTFRQYNKFRQGPVREVLRLVERPLLGYSSPTTSTVSSADSEQVEVASQESASVGCDPSRFKQLASSAVGTVMALDRFVKAKSEETVERRSVSK